jgi:hypothetical protein
VFGFPPLARQWSHNEPDEEDGERRAAQRPDLEAVHLEQVGRHPRQQPVEHGVERHPAQAHAPDRAMAEKAREGRTGGRRHGGILQRMGPRDMASLARADTGVLAGAVSNVPPGQPSARDRRETGHHEGKAP